MQNLKYNQIMIRKAKIKDVSHIQAIINIFAKRNEMLSRSKTELYDYLRDFFVAEEDGEIVGTCALHIFWEDLAEIRSLAVKEEKQKNGIGTNLVKACIEEAYSLDIKKIFVLTYKTEFFKRFGFSYIDKTALPHKIWKDCIHCPKFPTCDEIAMILDLNLK